MPELDRRDFLKVVGLSAGAAVTAACQEPVERVIPYLVQPEEIVPGKPTFYASTCRECPMGCAIHVKTREGRPIKVDGNPSDPLGRGASCVRGQAGLARTYDPTRFRGPLRREGGALVATSWEQGMGALVEKLRAAGDGRVGFIGGLETGTLDRLIDRFLQAIGSPNRVRFEPFAYESLRKANQLLFGTDEVPHFDLAAADVVVAFGTDFLESWLNPVQNQVGWSQSRLGGRGFAAYVGPRLGLTGGNCDEWLAPKPGSEILVALALAHELAGDAPAALRERLSSYAPAQVAEQTGLPAARIAALAARLRAAHAPLALPPGNEIAGTNATAFAAAVQILNQVSGAIGRTVKFGPSHNLSRLARFEDLRNFAGRMRGGEIDVLLVHGANPAYAMPAAFGFEDALAKVPFKVSFSSANDETTRWADLVLPDHTPFEAWGDAEPVRGVRRLQQPTVRPIFDTRATGDVLLDAARALGRGDALPAGDFRSVLLEAWGGPGADAKLAAGGELEPAAAQTPSLAASAAELRFETAQFSGTGELVLLASPSIAFFDGRSARLPRLHEIPDPVTKTVWDSYAELHPETAAALGVESGDVVALTGEGGSIEVRAFVHDCIAKGAVAVALGQGQQPTEPDLDPNTRWAQRDWLLRSERVGANVLSLLPGKLDAQSGGLAFYSAKVSLAKVGRREQVNVLQPTFDQQQRGFAQATTLAALLGQEEDHGDGPHLVTKAYDPARDSAEDSPYRWGLSIDLDACTGCGACVEACNQENNIRPIGPVLVQRGRELQWIRIERYVEHHGDELEVRHLPMMCQQCGAAPCESVCPVYATYHSGEGLNGMIYNRCIGTRYCSNNCPYKVRRFNYLPYDFEVREPEELGLNPDVTVRSKGVMEKCTFCVQRIQYARDEALAQKRTVRDGEVVTACEQACPSKAIVFGNLKDPESRVSRLRAEARGYRVLDQLYTRPAVSYLKSIRRGGGASHGGGHHG